MSFELFSTYLRINCDHNTKDPRVPCIKSINEFPQNFPTFLRLRAGVRPEGDFSFHLRILPHFQHLLESRTQILVPHLETCRPILTSCRNNSRIHLVYAVPDPRTSKATTSLMEPSLRKSGGSLGVSDGVSFWPFHDAVYGIVSFVFKEKMKVPKPMESPQVGEKFRSPPRCLVVGSPKRATDIPAGTRRVQSLIGGKIPDLASDLGVPLSETIYIMVLVETEGAVPKEMVRDFAACLAADGTQGEDSPRGNGVADATVATDDQGQARRLVHLHVFVLDQGVDPTSSLPRETQKGRSHCCDRLTLLDVIVKSRSKLTGGEG